MALKREQDYMSNGGFGLSGREGLALPGRLEFRERNIKETKEGERGEGQESKTMVKIWKGTDIQTWIRNINQKHNIRIERT